MNIIGGPDEAPFPLNVGLLFFNPKPHHFFPATQIDVVWFPDGAGGDRFEEKTFQGPLARMVREALDYLRRNYLSETVIKHPDRAEATRVENFPHAAVEEAVVNAIYHRSYEEREPVEVRISPEELIPANHPICRIKPLAEACAKTGFEIHVYCLMRHRFHLVVKTPNGTW